VEGRQGEGGEARAGYLQVLIDAVPGVGCRTRAGLQVCNRRLRHPPKSSADGRVLNGVNHSAADSHGRSPHPRAAAMDAAIDLSDVSKALDLGNIRFQLMYMSPAVHRA
jgi:hypothetical protein